MRKNRGATYSLQKPHQGGVVLQAVVILQPVDLAQGAQDGNVMQAAALGRDVLHQWGDDARTWSREAFDWDRIAEATETVYADALAGRPVNPSAAAASDADRVR